MRMIRVLIVAIIVLGTISGNSFALNVGDEIFDFKVKTIDGVEIMSADFKQKNPVMLVFWATWCPVCKEEIPKLKDIYETFHPRGMEILAINVGVNDSIGKVTRYVEKYKIMYPVIFEEGRRLTKKFNVLGTPTILIIDSRGVVQYRSAKIPDDLEAHFDML